LESYLIACRSILGEFDDVNEDNLDIVGDNYTKQAVKKIVKIESCVKREEFHVSLATFYCISHLTPICDKLENLFRNLPIFFARMSSHANYQTVFA
jgi:hypothetical protein